MIGSAVRTTARTAVRTAARAARGLRFAAPCASRWAAAGPHRGATPIAAR